MGRLDDIKARKEARRKAEHITLTLPGWDGDVAARYKVLSEDEIKTFGEGINAALDLLARSCIQVFERTTDGEYEGLENDNANPVAFDADLAERYDIPEEHRGTARSVVRHMLDNNPIAIDKHADKVVTWMADTSVKVEDAILGGFVPTRRSSSPDGLALSA